MKPQACIKVLQKEMLFTEVIDMNWTQKETSLLKDLKDQEQLCVDKYAEYAKRAHDPELKQLFEDIRSTEQQHLAAVCTWLGEQPPKGWEVVGAQFHGVNKFADDPEAKEADKYLCQDALCTEKEVSGAYNTSIFEFRDPQIRQQLHQIQGAEQKHGEMIYQYMARNGMYQAQ